MSDKKVLYIIVCAAGPAGDVWNLIDIAQEHEWTVQVVSTPKALSFLDIADLETRTGLAVRSEHRSSPQPRSPRADAIIIAPASFNSVNKLANGIADTYALDIANECIGLGVPTTILPYVNTAYASRKPFRESVQKLREEGASVLICDDGFVPHEPGSGSEPHASFPWSRALQEIEARKA
ncbi:hypothetical protein HNR25_004076 [Streptomonospora salina]|uniref:Flavoprotein domain-containing protein n=2 Tax=Streptomonospora salina TaxID=104205 RepID=A0A841EB13_9ACTN|nr:flavoprotein [Streptomonospora salina]MBB6000325.1 hypothetical protein [Streptomonospora salina]